jgi:hypothetical protein
MPTRFTKTAGSLGVASALLWLAVPGLLWLAGVLEPVGKAEGASRVVYGIGTLALLGGGALMVIVMRALDQRLGSLGGRGLAGTGLVALGVAASVAAFFYIGWGLLMMIGTILFASAMLGHDAAPRIPTLALGTGVASGGVVWAILRATEGTLLEYRGMWGDSWVANVSGVTVAALILAFGLFGLGRWLRGEEPGSLDAADGLRSRDGP